MSLHNFCMQLPSILRRNSSFSKPCFMFLCVCTCVRLSSRLCTCGREHFVGVCSFLPSCVSQVELSETWLQGPLCWASHWPSCFRYSPVTSHFSGIRSRFLSLSWSPLIWPCYSCHSLFESLFIHPTEVEPRSLVRKHHQLSGVSFPLAWLCPMLRDLARDRFMSSLLFSLEMDRSLTLCLWVLFVCRWFSQSETKLWKGKASASSQ